MSPARTLSRTLRTGLLTVLAITLLTATFFVGVAPSAAAPTFTLSLSSSGPGTIYAVPGGSQLPAGTAVQLTADADINGIFLGWTIDGMPRGWAEKITVKMNADHTVVANFVAATDFTDIYAGSYYNAAIDELAARGIIKGYGDGRVGPRDGTLRAQMAALITRAVGWDGEDHGNPFSDQGAVDSELWRNVGTLAHYDVAKGYGDGSYGPTDPVLRVQVIAFISRAMVAKGYWVQQPDDPALFTNVPASSGHRQDLATYARYVKYLPNTSNNATFADWDAPSIRGWFAAALWGRSTAISASRSSSTKPPLRPAGRLRPAAAGIPASRCDAMRGFAMPAPHTAPCDRSPRHPCGPRSSVGFPSPSWHAGVENGRSFT